MLIMTTKYIVALVAFLAVVHGSDGGRRGALSYVVHKGCLYMSHYVRDNYPVLEPTHDTSVNGKTNWVDWARDRAGASYLPDELLHGLIECGQGYTFYALSAPQSLITEHGLTGQLIPGR